MPKEISLTRGQVAIVDNADFGWLSQWKWYATKHRNTYYADRNGYISHTKHDTIRMHRLILDAPTGIHVDHIDGNGLNNQRSNLRLCTNQQNLANRPPLPGKSSQYKGVSFYRRDQIWRA